MNVTGTTRRVTKGGKISGRITVTDGKRKYRVSYEALPGGHAEQWGASTAVLCFTFATFEKLIAP